MIAVCSALNKDIGLERSGFILVNLVILTGIYIRPHVFVYLISLLLSPCGGIDSPKQIEKSEAIWRKVIELDNAIKNAFQVAHLHDMA